MEEGEDEPKSVDARIASKAHDQYGLISREQALELGASSTTIHRRLQEEMWLPVRWGVYRFAAVRLSWHQAVMAACLQVPGAVAYGRTAGWLYGLDGLGKSAPSPVELAVERRRHPRCADLDIHRVLRLKGEWTHHDGIPVTHLPRTVITLCGLLDEKNAELAVDSAMRGRHGLRGWLTRELAKYPPSCSGGPPVLRRLLKLRTTPTDSGLEVRFEQLLRKAGLPEPTYRMPVFVEGRRVASIDYVWEEYGLIVQTHGWQWHGHKQRWQTDIAQRRQISVERWSVVEVTRDDVLHRPEVVLHLLRRAMATAGHAFSSNVRVGSAPGWP